MSDSGWNKNKDGIFADLCVHNILAQEAAAYLRAEECASWDKSNLFCAENLSLLKNLTYFIWRFVIVPIISYSEIPDVRRNMTEDT